MLTSDLPHQSEFSIYFLCEARLAKHHKESQIIPY